MAIQYLTASVQEAYFETKGCHSVFHMQYWDAPGSSKFATSTARFCSGVTAAVFVFDG